MIALTKAAFLVALPLGRRGICGTATASWEEARQLLTLGMGHRCHLGDSLIAEVQQLDE
jgi:hypothetical protein